MRLVSAISAVVAVWICLLSPISVVPVQAAGGQLVSFPGKDGVTIRAIMFRPRGAGAHPAVVALHGCAGLFSPDGSLSPRHEDWAERLSTAGFLVLLPDSFGSRGLGPQCRVHDRLVRPARERLSDADDARVYLQTLSTVKPDAISLMGWSNGGSTVLHTVNADAPRSGTGPDFAKAVAFYPGCRIPNESGKWHARLPLLILIGASDTWTPPEPCQQLADTAHANGENVSIQVYPNAVHDFDHPNLPRHTREDLAYTGDGSGEADVGTNPAARADVLTRVPAFLAH